METLTQLAITDILPNPYQPRLEFSRKQLEELAASIREHGIIQPIIVRKSAVVGYELLAGERRLQASQLAGLTHIPAIIKELSDEELLYQAIIENLQRADLNPIEEALSYQNLVERGLTHDTIAQKMGKSRPYISNSIRLLQASPIVQDAVRSGHLSSGHARLLISLKQEEQNQWLKHILSSDMSVRSLEKALASKANKKRKKENIFIAEEEKILQQLLGTSVSIQQQKTGHGKLTIHFTSMEEGQRIIQNLKDSLGK